MSEDLSLLLYGASTPHDPAFVADRPGPRQDWIVLCFHTPALIRTIAGLEVAQAGDCVVHDAGYSEWHTTVTGATAGFRNDWLHIGVSGMNERTQRFGIPLNCLIPTGLAGFLSDHLRVIGDEDHRREQFWQERISAEIELLLLRIGRAHANHQTRATLSPTEQAWLESLTIIRSTMLERFNDPWSVERLAQMASISPNRFAVLYVQFFKISPIEELIRHRLQRSCTMLVSSAATLETIADACGFTDAAYFSRVFKQRMGCNPGAYRRRGMPAFVG